jgi:hypothetical protein
MLFRTLNEGFRYVKRNDLTEGVNLKEVLATKERHSLAGILHRQILHILSIIHFSHSFVSGSTAHCWALASSSVSSSSLDVRIPWTGDQPVARPPPTQNNANRYPASSAIRIHDSSDQAREDSSCVRPRGHCDWLRMSLRKLITT